MDTIDLNGKNMEGNGRKVWPNHSSPVTKEGNFSIEEKIDPVCIFLEKGKKSEIRNKTAQILDYDSIVPLDSNIAIPVFFRPKSRVLEGRKIYQVRKKHWLIFINIYFRLSNTKTQYLKLGMYVS